MPTPVRRAAKPTRRATKPTRAAKPTRRASKPTRRAAKPTRRGVAPPTSPLQETLFRYEAGKYLRPTQNRPSIAVPNEHKPGPLGVTLPTVPRRPRGVTEIEVVIAVDQYIGIQHGRAGAHEIIEGHITVTNAIANKKVFDTKNVQLAMNVASAVDPNGLPSAIPVKAGDQLEVEGEYIPSKQAKAHNSHGAAAVIHFTHAPAGYVIFPDATEYK